MANQPGILITYEEFERIQERQREKERTNLVIGAFAGFMLGALATVVVVALSENERQKQLASGE